ncbi:MAG: CocE/NonD family hydrolase [Candidatus Latescibacterota bacterium]
MDTVTRQLPLVEQDRAVGWRAPFLRDWLAHPERDPYWERSSIGGQYPQVTAAAYHTGGWFDSFLNGTLEGYVAMTSPEVDPQVRARQKLRIGPWAHVSTGPVVGELDFGAAAAFGNTDTLRLRWFDSQLKGLPNGILDEPPVQLFVMGRNVWRLEHEWPLARTRYTAYYLHSAGRANTLSGDGVLSPKPPGREPPDGFTYDPQDPVPSTADGSPLAAFAGGPYDHRRIEARPDVLVYTTPVLQRDLEVTGPVVVNLHAASSAPNTDFTAKLLDVYPDGRAMRLCEGILRASFRDGPTHTSNITPGQVYAYRIDLWATSNVFLEGHRIRVEVSSSNFPRFDRNLNTGLDFAADSTWARAEQTIYHTAEHASHIVLPVIE